MLTTVASADEFPVAVRRLAELAKGKLTIPTPYGEAWCWLTLGGKHPAVVIGLHGGGEDADRALRVLILPPNQRLLPTARSSSARQC